MTPVLIMAGGRGTRLHPITESKPKPLVPAVGGRPMLETMIREFADQGFRRIWLSVHYKADLIEAYFGDGARLGVKIRYLHEPEALGTGGALHLFREAAEPDVPFLVSNADVIAKLRYGELMAHHAQSGAQATVCLGLHQAQVRYGVAEVEGGRLIRLREKPIESWPVNAGIYVIEPAALDHMPDGRFDMPALIERLDHVGVYALKDPWFDIGKFEDLGRAAAGASE